MTLNLKTGDTSLVIRCLVKVRDILLQSMMGVCGVAPGDASVVAEARVLRNIAPVK